VKYGGVVGAHELESSINVTLEDGGSYFYSIRQRNQSQIESKLTLPMNCVGVFFWLKVSCTTRRRADSMNEILIFLPHFHGKRTRSLNVTIMCKVLGYEPVDKLGLVKGWAEIVDAGLVDFLHDCAFF